jgi:hypothetical protein
MPFAPRASTLCAPKAVAPIGNIGHDCAQSACTCSFSAVTAALAGAASSPRRAEHLLRKLLRALPKSRTLSPLSKPMCAIIFAFAHCAPFSSQSLGPFQWLCFALYHYVLILSPPSRSFIDDILGFVTAPCLCIGALIIPTSSTLLPRGLLPTSQHPFHSSTSYRAIHSTSVLKYHPEKAWHLYRRPTSGNARTPLKQPWRPTFLMLCPQLELTSVAF